MKIEYSIREVTRYVLTEYHQYSENGNAGCGSRAICEFDSKSFAENMCSKLNEDQAKKAAGDMPD